MKKILIIFACFLVPMQSFSAGLIQDTEIETLLSRLIKPLALAADIQGGRLKISIVNDSSFNAFVKGGEEVFVYTGLLSEIESPLALQAVIAHELGHTLGGHMVQMSARLASEIKRGMIIQALGIGLMVAGGNPALGAGVLVGSGGIAQQSLLSFSRDEERIADNLGVNLLIKAGLNPNGLVIVLEQMGRMTESMESKINPNKINHPMTAERIKNVKETIAKAGRANDKTGLKNPKTDYEYSLVRAKLTGYLDTPMRVKNLYPETDKKAPAVYARAIFNMRNGDLKSAKQGAELLIKLDSNNPYFYELLGDIEYQYGHFDSSINAYEQSVKILKTAPQIETALALVLSERKGKGDEERAIEFCKRAILQQPAPLTYFVLSRIYTDGKSNWARAEYYNLLGDGANAKKYALRAKKSLPENTPEYIKSSELLR